jgi:glucose 1-dehydrogenase
MENSNKKKLAGQIALVTGASSGIGAGVAQALAAEGAIVVVNYSKSATKAQSVADGIREKGGQAMTIQADVSNEDQVLGMFDKILKEFGTLDILVNNAGLQQDAPFTEMTLKQWHYVLDVNLTGQRSSQRISEKRCGT